MTEKGYKRNAAAAPKALTKKGQAVNFVARQEKDKDKTFSNVLYKVVEVPLGHDDASSSVDMLPLQWFSPVTEEEENGLMEYKLHT